MLITLYLTVISILDLQFTLLMKKIDNGKILKVSRFRILKNDNVETFLKKDSQNTLQRGQKIYWKTN